MNEHGFNTLRTIQKNMKQQKEISNQLMSEMEQNDFVSLDDSSNENKEHSKSKTLSDGDDDDDSFNMDGDDGYVRNKLNDKQTQNIPTMNESESRSRYDSFYKLKKPKLQIIQYSNAYYYSFLALIPSDFVIRVISIGFLQRILFGDDMNNFGCLLWYVIIFYFVIWRFTYSENYGSFCWGYERYEHFESTIIAKQCPLIGQLIKMLIVIAYNVMPSGYMYYGNFHRELYPKILILINNVFEFILFIVFLFIFNRHLNGHHFDKLIQYEMPDKYEDIALIIWEIVLSVAWIIYLFSLYFFHREGTKQLEEQLETLIPSYEDDHHHHF